MRKKIGLALGGGGTRGSYQLGAYYAFKKCNIKFDVVVGTSIGSFNAAMIASKSEEKLKKFWENINMNKILEVDEGITKKEISFTKVQSIIEFAKNKISNKGFNIAPLREELSQIFDENKLRNSNIDFGCCTVKKTGNKVVQVFLKDMVIGKVDDYILASCYLPIFKKEKLIDDDEYLDGGFYDSVPVDMLETWGCDKIYAVHLNGFGPIKKVKSKNIEVINIKPTASLGSQLTLNTDQIKRNIKLGYYDTLKVLNNLDGKSYYFKSRKAEYFDRLIKHIDSKELKALNARFLAKNNKDLVIKAIEFVLKLEQAEVFKIYDYHSIIKYISKNFDGKERPYKFIKNISKEFII